MDYGIIYPGKTSKLWKPLIIKGMIEEEIEQKLTELIHQGIIKMEEDMVTCKYCKQKFPKEHVIDKNFCHDCALKYEGVVF